MTVSIKKVREAPQPEHSSVDWNEHVSGLPTASGFSLPIGYELCGKLTAPIVIGECIEVLRTHRNGEEVLGWFRSSTVRDIQGDEITTVNSVYQLIEIHEKV